MLIGSWLFCRTKDISVEYFYPYSKKGRNRVFQPFFRIKTPSGSFHIHGKRALWSILDALFHDDPLPRRVINDELKDHEEAMKILNGLFQDDEATPFIRFHVKTGNYYDHDGKNFYGSFILSASPSTSQVDVTPVLMMLENTFEGSFVIPITLSLKLNTITMPCLIIPLKENENYKIMVTDSFKGNHIIFSIIEAKNTTFRPQRMSVENNIAKITDECLNRLNLLKQIFDFRFIFPQLSSLDAGMRYYERDDLEFRRFLSCENYNSFNTFIDQQKE